MPRKKKDIHKQKDKTTLTFLSPQPQVHLFTFPKLDESNPSWTQAARRWASAAVGGRQRGRFAAWLAQAAGGVGLGGRRLLQLFVGGADEVRQLNEAGQLRHLLDSAAGQDLAFVCNACGGVRFVPSNSCGGGRKVFVEDERRVVRCGWSNSTCSTRRTRRPTEDVSLRWGRTFRTFVLGSTVDSWTFGTTIGTLLSCKELVWMSSPFRFVVGCPSSTQRR
ncbi:uncharacterized protein [Miscanthus floridulus]|uniref:uncharacterized protein n=1 Tax=Miscanthus floridulus TaxID=154761 RepID=UPI00345A6BC8